MDNLAFAPVTINTRHTALAAGTTTTFSANATEYAIRGKSFLTNAAANAATPTLDASTGLAFLPVPANRGCVFVFCYDGTSATAATAIKVVQGTIEPLDGTASGATALFTSPPQFPAIPRNLCPFGYAVTKVGASGAAWTFGVSNLSGPPANTLHTFASLFTLPDRPQVA